MKNHLLNRKIFQFLFSAVIIAFFWVLSLKRGAPIYGKFEFLSLSTSKDIYEFAAFLDEKYDSSEGLEIVTDQVTGSVLHHIFGLKKFEDRRSYTQVDFSGILPVLEKRSEACLINFTGFSKNWVAWETGHWHPQQSETKDLYVYKGYSGPKILIKLENDFSQNPCHVYDTSWTPWEPNEVFRYHMPNLNSSFKQQDVHLLQLKNNKEINNYLIDVGRETQVKERLLDYLARKRVFSIDKIFISHPHKDHYGGLRHIIEFGLPIKSIIMNMPEKKSCDKEIPWGCDFKDLTKLMKYVKQNDIEFNEIYHIEPLSPLDLVNNDDIKIQLLYASPAYHPAHGRMDINDLSLILKVIVSRHRYLFTRDLNNPVSRHLEGKDSMQADFFKVPHNGTEGVATNAYFDTVNPKVALVPSPAGLWCSERSKRIRDYFEDNEISVIVSGFHGDVMIRHFDDGSIQIQKEFEEPLVCSE